jgi:hypothetical protein
VITEYVLSLHVKKTGLEAWSAVSYHSTMKDAARWLFDRLIRDETTEGQGWNEVIVAVERAHARVREMVK